jgi:hypothetical protein
MTPLRCIAKAVLAACLAVAATGCAGARTALVAPDSRYPVSLTRGVRDADGELVPTERRLVVGKFEESVTAWGLLYSAVNITPTTDVSQAINEQVSALRGDAIVSLHIATADCALDWFIPLNVIPIWPGCTNVRLEGEIVRVLPPGAQASLAHRGAP